VLNATELGIALLFVLSLVLTSILDVAFSSVNKISFRRFLDRPEIKAAPALASMLENRTEVLMSIHLLVQSILVAGAVFLFAVFNVRHVPYVASMSGTIVLMFGLIVLFRQLIPRLVVARNPEMVLIYLSAPFRLCWILMRPFARMMTVILNYFHSWEEEITPEKVEEATEEEIQAFIDAGQEEGILEDSEGEMIQSIVHFGEKTVRDIMTPRTQIVAIDINSSVENLLQLVTTRSHTRIPVFRDDLDNVEGFIHERDLLRLWQNAEPSPYPLPEGEGRVRAPLAKLVRPVHLVPETKPVDDLLNEMKQRGDHIVLVVDEYGGISGLATMEDLIEEIVGEIHDQESEEEKMVQEAPGTYLVPGSVELSAVNEALGVPFVQNTECTTVAGAVVELFGRLPSAGERIEHDGIAVEVLDADRRKVRRLRMTAPAPRA
jgi:CBS domain containing-hemolysin-like protein